MAKPKLALIPATQGSKLYSVLPADGVGDFNFSRNSAATRINKDGLIETVASGVSRLNYPLIDGVVNGCPSHLLEPTRSNILPYSEDFSNAAWVKNGSSVTSGFTSPDGTTSAFKLIEDSSNSIHRIYNVIPISNGVTYTQSIFAKKGGRNFLQIMFGGKINPTDFANFDLENGVITSEVGDVSPKIEYYGNGWYKCSATATSTQTSSEAVYLTIVENGQSLRSQSYQGDGTSGIYIFGAQLEQGSFPTSYIKTVGISQTRVADTATGAGDASTFNDSEGVLYAEISALASSDTSYRALSLSDGTSSNKVQMWIWNNGTIFTYIVAQGSTSYTRFDNVNSSNINKISISYKQNQFSTFINGIKTFSDVIGNTPTGLNNIRFSDTNGSANFYGNIKDVRVYNTALSDAELTTLTTI